MKKIDFKNLLKQAFLITWRHKFFWIFGFLILLGSLPTNVDTGIGPLFANSSKQQLLNLLPDSPITLTVFFVTFLVIVLFVIAVKIIGSSATILASNNVKVFSQSPISSILFRARKYLPKLLIVEGSILFSFVMLVTVLILPVIYLFKINSGLFALAGTVLALLISLLLLLLAYYLRRYAYIYVVLGNMKPIKAIESSYFLLEQNIKESLQIGLIVMFLNVGLILFVAFAIVLLSVLLIPLYFIVLYLFGGFILSAFIFIAALLLLIILSIVFSWFESMIQCLWVLFFQQLTLEKKKNKKADEAVRVEGELPTPEAV